MKNPKTGHGGENNALMIAEREKEIAMRPELGMPQRRSSDLPNYRSPVSSYGLPKDPTIFFVNGSDPEIVYRDDLGEKRLTVSSALESYVAEAINGYDFLRISPAEEQQIKSQAYQNAHENSGRFVFCKVSERNLHSFLDIGNIRNYPIPGPNEAWTPQDVYNITDRVKRGTETFEDRRSPKSE